MRFIEAKRAPRPECQFCGYPLIGKEHFKVDNERFCRAKCIKEYFQHDDEELVNIAVKVINPDEYFFVR